VNRHRRVLILVLLLLVALGTRLYRLAELPPGLFHDEAYNTLDAQALAEGLPHPRFYDSWEVYARTIHETWPPATTRFPVFLEGNYGREALFHYFGAVAVALVGPRVWALRLVAALAGTVNVLVAYWVARELFADEPARATRLGLLAAAVATGIYSLFAFSRLGLRIVTLVTLEGLTVALWWRAGRDGRLRSDVAPSEWRLPMAHPRWALAGLMLGLSQYTYIPARLLPLLVVGPALIWIVRHPQRRPQLVRGTLLALLVALAVAAPLIVFFVRYPAYLTLRADAIAADAPERGLAVVVANVGRALLGLVWRGDPNPILNLPGRPLLDVLQSVFLVAGVLVCLGWKPAFFHKSWFLDRLPYAFLLLWAAVMHAPSFVSGIAPTFGRSIGGALPVAVIVAVGLEAVWTSVVGRWSYLRPWATLVVIVVLCFSAGLTAHDYFTVWARLPGLPHIFHEDMATVGRYIGRLSEDAVVYITPTQKYYATLLLAMAETESDAKDFSTDAAIPMPPFRWRLYPQPLGSSARDRPRDFYGPAGLLPAGDPGREVVYLILEGDETTAALLEAIFPAGRWDTRDRLGCRHSDGASAFAAYRVSPAADHVRPRPQWMVQAGFADLIQVVGFDLLSTDVLTDVHPGDTLSVRLTWRALASMDRHYTAFVHLLGPENPALGSPLWAQDDHEPGHATYSTDRWFPGEVIIDTFDLHVPDDAPPGVYTLSTGFYDLETLERLPRSDAPGDTATMTTLTLAERVP